MIYTYRSGDDVCTPFATDDPVVAAGLYADENGVGQVFVVVEDRVEEYDVGGEHDDLSVDRIGTHLDLRGWVRATRLDWDACIGITVRAERRGVSVLIGDRVLLTAVEPDAAALLASLCTTAEAEAVLRMAAHVAWGGREAGEVRDA